ncbi:MAG: GNAT family N-acetyltransferase [Christensenellales bacterium]
MELVIKPLSPALTDDFLKFFDETAFSDNPAWAGCYCSFYHFTRGWEERTASQNRAFAQEAVKSGLMSGYMATIDGEPAGWVNAGPRDRYIRLKERKGLIEGNTCSIVCFVIAPSRRRQGIATRLLSAVLEGAKGKYDFVEAYPSIGAQSAAHHYHGPLAMYQKAGFEVVLEMEGYDVVRKRLST